jgi:hypothetical protein
MLNIAQKHSIRLSLFLLGLSVLMLPTVSGVFAQDPSDPFETAKTAFLAAETDAAKLGIAKGFLNNHPQHEQAGMVTDQAVDLLRGPLNDYSGAIALAKTQLLAAGESEIQQEIQEILMGLYSKPGYGSELAELVGQMFDFETMIYTEHLTVLKAATGAENWALVDKHVEKATPLATPEAFRAAYPDREFTDEYVEGAGRNRQGLLKTFTGWSAANQGDTEQAIQEFLSANSLVRKNFFGLTENNLSRYWGQTLVQYGDSDRGVEKLALAGLFGADNESAEIARQTFLATGKSEADFEKFLWKLRQKHSVQMVDFQATDYKDVMHSYNDLKGKKATLLAFWFPT